VPKFDLAVVGAGLGGLVAAALAARRGKLTVVLEPGDAAGGVLGAYQNDGFHFFSGPHISFGFERDGSVQRLGESLGIALDASLHSPCYQVALPDRRITVYAEHSEMLEELSREFAPEIDGIAKFYRELRRLATRMTKSSISSFLLRRKTARGFIRRYHFSREFTAFLEVQSLFFFGRRAAELSLPSLVTLCDTRPFAVHGGFTRIAEQMVEVILKNRGEIRHGVRLPEIGLKNGRPAGLSTPQETLDARAVLLNTEQQPGGAVLFLGVQNNVIPAGMLHNVICLADYSHPEDFFTLAVSPKDDEYAAPKGMNTLTASFPARSAHPTHDDLVHAVGALVPFLKDFVVLTGAYEPASRVYTVPGGISYKTLRMPDNPTLVRRYSGGNVYLLADGSATPVQEIAAAQTLFERLERNFSG
jgi:glycine/D-amino acid oxidase-like deaminating enzyme